MAEYYVKKKSSVLHTRGVRGVVGQH